MDRIKKSIDGCRDKDLADVLSVAVHSALEAGKILRDLYGRPHKIRHKGVIDLVTEADVAAEKAILEIITKAMPGVNILAEESSDSVKEAPAGPVWIIDPLDGTTNFAHNFPWFAVSIGFAVDGHCRAGVIYCPLQDELFSACFENGAWLNGERIKVSEAELLNESLLATGFPYDVQEDPDQVITHLRAVLTKSQGIRRAGAAAVDLAYVACGRLDGFWEVKLKPWDTAAGQVLIQEAGGRLTTFRGEEYSPYFPEVLATNSLIHEEIIEILSRF